MPAKQEISNKACPRDTKFMEVQHAGNTLQGGMQVMGAAIFVPSSKWRLLLSEGKACPENVATGSVSHKSGPHPTEIKWDSQLLTETATSRALTAPYSAHTGSHLFVAHKQKTTISALKPAWHTYEHLTTEQAAPRNMNAKTLIAEQCKISLWAAAACTSHFCSKHGIK